MKFNFYYDRTISRKKSVKGNSVIVKEHHIPNGLPDNLVKYYYPRFDAELFRKEIGCEAPVYPSELPTEHLKEIKRISIKTIDDKETKFKGFYHFEFFGSARNAVGICGDSKDKYNSVFDEIFPKTLQFLHKGVLKLVIGCIQENFNENDIWITIHNKLEELSINNSIVAVNDHNLEKNYTKWCKENNFKKRFDVVVFCHSLYEKSFEVWNLVYNNKEYGMAEGNKVDYKGSAITYEEWIATKDVIRDHKVLSMNRRLREHRVATLCVLSKYDMIDNASFQFMYDKVPYGYVRNYFPKSKENEEYKLEYNKLKEMQHNWIDYPISLSVEDGVHHGYGWENKQPYINSYLNITTETCFQNDTGYASEKIWKPFGFFQPVINVGSPETLKFIRSFGFKTFDGFIDESYDLEWDYRKRWKLIQKEIIKIGEMSKQEVHDWYWSMGDILNHNFQLFMKFGSLHNKNYRKNIWRMV